MITAILNCYRRPRNITTQIDALMKQTVKPTEIWIWKNYHEDFDKEFDWPAFSKHAASMGIRTIDSNYNWKYCGRFSLACMVDTEYTAIFDDDTIPAPKWFENCLKTLETHRGILGSVGVRMHTSTGYRPNTRIGWSSNNENIEEVDLVGHSWFHPSEYNKYMWYEKPMWENAEDCHFSAMAQKHGGVKTYVPAQPISQPELNGSMYGQVLGVDDVASSAVRNHEQFYKERNAYVQKLVAGGWKLYKDQ